jgi:hypothetical protein
MHNLPDLPTLAAFAAHLHSTFRLADASGAALTLSEAAALDPAQPEQGRFSLIFQGPLQPALPQATHPLEHRELGGLAIFLVPVGVDAGSVRYQAIFN